ncbi:MAG: acyl-CoA dehydrogenase family protein [Gammaproteobacteria bacterium]|nr:acyl-CoA dehydrogenase family protein [Gammaproteobacteria bacterium]
MNESQKMLEDAVTRLFSERVTREFLAESESGEWPAGLWDLVAEQGLTHVLVSEAGGGMGGGWLDAFVVARACGRYAVPLPVPEAILALHLIERAGLQPREGVPGLLPRPLKPREFSDRRCRADVARVPWGRHADYFVGTVSDGRLAVVSKDAAEFHFEQNLAREPRDRVVFDGATVLDFAPLDLPADCVEWLGALLRSAQIAGAGAGCLELSVEYTSQREQFGRLLSQFQAIQHHLAELAGQVAAVDTIAAAACNALDRRGMTGGGRNATLEIAAAKCLASQIVEMLTRQSHQVHGAIGFTYEYTLHYLTRRLWSWRAEFGGVGHWGEHLGRVALDQGGDRIWNYLTA